MLCSLLLLALCAGPLEAQTFEDYERAREALERNEILPLADLLARVESEFDGRMIEVEFEVDDGRYVYEFELISRDGHIREIDVDAATGEILGVEIEEDDDD